jgi:hypothetical protein
MARNWARLRFFEHPETKQSRHFGKDTRMGMIWSEYAALARSLLECHSFANERIKGARPG